MTDAKAWIEERRTIHEAAAEPSWWTTRDLQPATVFAGDGSADDIAVLTTFEHSDATAVVDAHNNLPRALDALHAVLEQVERMEIDAKTYGAAGHDCASESLATYAGTLRQAIEGAIND